MAPALSVIIVPLISHYSPPLLSLSGAARTQTNSHTYTNSNETLSKQESGPDYLLCRVYYCKKKKKKHTHTQFKTSAPAFPSHISLVKRDVTEKTQLKSGRKPTACSFYGDFKLDHSATMAGSDRAIKGHHLLYLSSDWCVWARSRESMSLWTCGAEW